MTRILLLLLVSTCLHAVPVQIFAAASTVDALQDIKKDLKSQRGIEISIHTAGSATIAHQIKHGAPCDIVLLADQEWMNNLMGGRFVKNSTVKPLLSNEMVIIASKKNDFGTSEILSDPTLQISVANTEAIPAGRYAKKALKKKGWWVNLAPKLVQASNTRIALKWVESNQTPLGIVYKTDADGSNDVRALAALPLKSGIISYPVACCASSKHPDGTAVMDYLMSEQSVAHFLKRGFGDGRR